MKRKIKVRAFPAFHKRLRELDMQYTEAAERMGLRYTTFCNKMAGRAPWTEPEMQRALYEFCDPEEQMNALFPRRAV